MLVPVRRLLAALIVIALLHGQSLSAVAAKPVPDDPPQVKEAMQRAGELLQAKKFDEARKAFEAIAAAHPKCDIAARARLGIVNTYREQGKLAAAIPALELVLAKDEHASLASVQKAQPLLVKAKKAATLPLVKAKKFDDAIAELRRIVDDKQTTPAGARAALIEIAIRQVDAGQIKEAIATYRDLLKLPPLGDRERLADLAELTRLDPSAVGEIGAFIRGHAAAPRDYLALARDYEGAAYVRLKRPDDAAASFAAALAYPDVPFHAVRLAMIGKADVMFLKNDRDGAVAVYRELLKRPALPATIPPGRRAGEMTYRDRDRLEDLNRLAGIAAGMDVTAESALFLDNIREVKGVSLGNRAPKSDVLYAIQSSPPHLAAPVRKEAPRYNGTYLYSLYLKENPGVVPKLTLEQVDAQLAKGGPLRPFATSDFSKKVAAAISADAPMADYLRPLLGGDFQSAAQAAWRHSRLARRKSDRDNWIEGVVVAIGCADQSRATRAESFYNWANPDSKAAKAKGAAPPDPLTGYLGLPALPYETDNAALAAAAAAEINRRDNVIGLYTALAKALPDNDAAIYGTHSDQAKTDYEIYLWRTTGRAAADLAELPSRLEHAGANKLFVVSPQSRQLAGMIEPTAPMGAYFRLLFNGEHQAAARLAWKNAEEARRARSPQYFGWTLAVALAARCHDQEQNGRAAKFIPWVEANMGKKGEPATPNPLADFLKE